MKISFITQLSDSFCHYLVPISKHALTKNYSLPGMYQVKFFPKKDLDLKIPSSDSFLLKAFFDYVPDKNLNSPPICRSVSFEVSKFNLVKGKDYNVLLDNNNCSKEYDPKFPLILPCRLFFFISNRFYFQRIDDTSVPIFSRGLQSHSYPVFEFLNLKHTTTLNKNSPGILSIPEVSIFQIWLQSSVLPIYEKYIITDNDSHLSERSDPINLSYSDDIFTNTELPANEGDI